MNNCITSEERDVIIISYKGKEYGIDDIGNSVQATFFDYDKDGDLDLYVANYPPTPFDAPNAYYYYKMQNVKDDESDNLYRNDNGVFTKVTDEAGLRSYGLTLSATIGDINNDSYPDIFVSNDFSSPDYMYINNQDGSFTDIIKESTSQTSFYGMGADIADFNYDFNLDYIQVDMDARDNRRSKANMASMNVDLFWSTVNYGFHYQYMHNTLQLNRGVFNGNKPFLAMYLDYRAYPLQIGVGDHYLQILIMTDGKIFLFQMEQEERLIIEIILMN